MTLRLSDLRVALAPLRAYAAASLAVFVIGAAAGGLSIFFLPEAASDLQGYLKQFAELFRGLSPVQLAAAIFLNNSIKTLLVILLGPLLGLLPIVFLFLNGAILGALVPAYAATSGLWKFVLAILPHGIFELPAIFLGTSIGLRLGCHPVRRLAGKANTTLIRELTYGLGLFAKLIAPLLLLAALVEAFVTPLVAGR